MVRLLLISIFAVTSVAPASAFQKFEEYRIIGSEIRAVQLGPQEVEDPATLIIDLVSDGSGPQQISLESDGGLDECKQTIDYTIGDSSRYVQIRVHTSADTMNGMMVTECTTVSLPGS